MMKGAFIVSSITIKNKWEILVASDIIKEIPFKKAGLLQIDALCAAIGYKSAIYKNKKIKKFSAEEAQA